MTVSQRLNRSRRLEPLTAYAAGFMLLGVAVMFAGIHLGGCRDPMIWRFGPCPEWSGLYSLERSLVAASVIATAIGLGMLSELTRGTPGLGPAKAGASLYTFGAVLVVAVELALADGGNVIPGAEALVVGYVVLAFLGETALGWGLIKGIEGMKVVGWVTIILNLGGLTFVLLASRDDMYFPIAHVVMPAVIAITLLVRSRRLPNEKAIGATKVRNGA